MKKKEELIDEIMFNFDFITVQNVIRFLGMRNLEITIEEIKDEALSCLEKAFENPDKELHNSGWHFSYKNNLLILRFCPTFSYAIENKELYDK